MIKKLITIILVCLLFTTPVFANTNNDQFPEVSAAAYVLYNPDNDEVVEGKNENTKMYPASLTKMMTALTVFDLCQDLDETITVSENAVTSLYGTQSSTAKLKIGEKITVKNMLYLMLMPSGNDAANALAEHFCGSNIDFAEKMNQKAKEIGMNNSNFVNPHGLHDQNHYTTATDLAILSDFFIQNEELYKIAKCVEFTMPQTNLQVERPIRSTNYMLINKSGYYYPYATGLKTGNTDSAGRCLAASAEKDGKKFICIFLDVPEVWNRNGMVRTDFLEAAELFKYAFDNYETVKVAQKGTKIKSYEVSQTFSKKVDLVLNDDIYATVKKGTDFSSVSINFVEDSKIQNSIVNSPVVSGDVLGNAEYVLNNKIIGSQTVVAKNTVNPSKLIVFWKTIDLYVYIVLIIIGLLILTFILLIIRKNFILYKRRKAKERRLERQRRKFQEFQTRAPQDYFKMD